MGDIGMNSVDVTEGQPYTILPQWHSQPAKLRVIHVGAGAAGLLMAYRMKKLFTTYELVCYENQEMPKLVEHGMRIDTPAVPVMFGPAHAYTYAFEPNPNWSSFYAYAPEIEKYFKDFAAKYNLMPFIKLNSRVRKAVWFEEKGIYEVEIESEGKIIKDWCNVLVNGTGFLNSWKWPSIPGLHDFKGTLAHSAHWDTSINFEDKTVAVIGTGSSAIQIVPQVQKKAKHLTSFMRSVTWISPPVGGNVLEAQKEKARTQENGSSDHASTAKTPNGQYYYTEDEKKRFREEPEYHLQYRQKLESAVNDLYEMFIRDSETSKAAEVSMRAEMLKRIGPGHEELKEKLIPSWPPGCRRITPGDGYLEALVQPNVTTIHKEIVKIVPEGLVDEDGTIHKVDIIICATGFNLAFAPPFELRGVEGVSMAEEFDPEPHVYLAVTVPKFPNYFVINGVRGNWAAGTALPSHEVQVEYILKCVARIQNENIRAFEVKQKPTDELNDHIDEWHKMSVWNADCKSWYKNNIIGGKLWIWGGSALHYMKTMKEVKYEHYDFRYFNKNMWGYLGNGRIEAEVFHDIPKLAPYMRNSDVEWTI